MCPARAAIIRRTSHGDGRFTRAGFAALGTGVVFEQGVRVFHPEQIEIGDDVYVGHDTILKGYYRNRMVIGAGTWIGQQCFLHSAGGLRIGRHVGIGPGVNIITSFHRADAPEVPILHTGLAFEPVIIEDDCDIGVGTIILPGVTIGMGALIGAGAVVTRDVPAYAVAVGNPARTMKSRMPSRKRVRA